MTSNRRFLSLCVVVVMSFMSALDASIINVALPVLTRELDVPLSSIEWVVAMYVLCICIMLLFFGRMGDVVGKSRVFSFGTLLFTLGSLACGLCHSFLPLVICRGVQGIGASAYMANNYGLITELFPERGRGRALGILAAAVALGTMIGPPIGGAIVSHLPWNCLFWVNIPIGGIVFALGVFYLPENTKNNEHIDWQGGILQGVGMALFFGTFLVAQQTGFARLPVVVAFGAAVLFFALFILREKRVAQPLLDLSLLGNLLFSLSLLCALISYVCMSAILLLIPFYLMDSIGLSPASAGLFMMISPVIVVILSPICGALSDKVGAERLSAFGLLLMSCGFVCMSQLDGQSLVAVAALFVLIVSIGQAFFQPANNSVVMSSCPRNKLGIAGSMNSLVRNLGIILGLTIATTVLYGFMSWRIGYHVHDYVAGRDDVFIFGVQNVYRMLTCICLVGGMLTLFRMVKSRGR